LAERLIIRFAVCGMTGWNENGGMFRRVIVRHVEQGSDVNMWQAFENQLFDVKAGHLNLSGDMRIQRRLFCWQAAQHLQNMLAESLLNSPQVLLSSNTCPSVPALIVFAPGHLCLISQIVGYRGPL